MSDSNKVYQFKIYILRSSPLIWRRFQISSGITLLQLHVAIQIIMGWEDYHLHQFIIDDERYTLPNDDPIPGDINEIGIGLNSLVNKVSQKFFYEYDFGDSWEHELILEKIIIPNPKLSYPICLEGHHACPPEDCGGIEKYNYTREAYLNEDHPKHSELLEWLGYKFDPNLFDTNFVNRHLASRIRAI